MYQAKQSPQSGQVASVVEKLWPQAGQVACSAVVSITAPAVERSWSSKPVERT